MKPICEREFETCHIAAGRERPGAPARVMRGLAALKRVVHRHDDADRLSPRLRRDAGLDELDIELRRIARAPLIR